MLTTTIDGLWVLQILTGIEVVAPELGLRPTLPSCETVPMALTHPIATELHTAGVLDDAGEVDATVLEWLTVLARRDLALLIRHRGTDGSGALALVARFAQWWVVLERSEELIRLSGAGTASASDAASVVLTGQLERLCGSCPPAPLRPVTLAVDALLAGVRDQETMRGFLEDHRVTADQLRILTTGADPQQSSQASIVALQSGVSTGGPTRTHIEASAVTIIDTPEGRIVAEHVLSAGQKWLVLGPGTVSSIRAAVTAMLCRLPADQEWHSHRKAI